MSTHKSSSMGGEQTVLARANDKSYSLRTTVPKGIVKQFEMREGNVLNWKIESNGNGLRIVVELEKTKGKKVV